VARVFNKPFSAATLARSVQELLEPEDCSSQPVVSSRPNRRIYSSN
jgi:hypothetical protein